MSGQSTRRTSFFSDPFVDFVAQNTVIGTDLKGRDFTLLDQSTNRGDINSQILGYLLHLHDRANCGEPLLHIPALARPFPKAKGPEQGRETGQVLRQGSSHTELAKLHDALPP